MAKTAITSSSIQFLYYKQHPDYISFLYDDIAILELSENFELNEYVDVACLPDENIDYAGYDCYISGWGLTEYDLLIFQFFVVFKGNGKFLEATHFKNFG